MGLGAIMGGISLVSGLIGGSKSAKAAKKQANLQNEATERQFEYDNKLYDMTAEQIKAKHAFAIKETALKRKNEGNAAAYRDAINAQNYSQQLLIRNREQASLDNQFRKSGELYDMQMGYNQRAAALASENEQRKLEEIHAEGAFSAQEQRLKLLEAEGATRAIGQSGTSVGKTHQSIAANFGFQIAALNAGLASAGEASLAALAEIKNDKFSADLAAYANKMEDPGELPMPVVPIPSIVTEYMDPQALQDFHFGPRPVKGATVSASAAASAAWGAAIPSILSTGLQTYKAFKV
tara:strand:+ start:173 stop:1054 length:882 start_codon:yes stop_codon:yes gene_type:complete